jgi:hypothetical protein
MAEEQLKRESRREPLAKLLSAFIGLLVSVAAAYFTGFTKEPFSNLGKEFGTTLAASFGLVLLQSLAIYLRQRHDAGAELKRRVQGAYIGALEQSALNPRGKGVTGAGE